MGFSEQHWARVCQSVLTIQKRKGCKVNIKHYCLELQKQLGLKKKKEIQETNPEKTHRSRDGSLPVKH